MSTLRHPQLHRRRSPRRPARGRGSAFTLIEVLLAAALTVLVIGLLLIPLTGGIGYFRSATARGDAQTVARNALEVMARELSEAAYIQQDMNDSSMVAFYPPLRITPNDPTSQIVTPPRPDWNHGVRYWRALRDPNSNYASVRTLGEPNTYFLARTVIDDPLRVDDPWNLATRQATANATNDPATHWAPVTRAVYTDLGYTFDGSGNPVPSARNKTFQPGYPFLAAQWLDRGTGRGTSERNSRFYRDRIKPLTPNAADYDVTALSFEPMVVSGEWLTPALGREAADKSVYLARYPLWRLGVPFTSWTALEGEPQDFITRILQEQQLRSWQPRDPFLLIYRYVPGSNPRYQLYGLGCFDVRSRALKVLNPDVDSADWLLWDTYDYPARTPKNPVGFDVNWINGSVRFDFPPYDPVAQLTVDRPLKVAGEYLAEQTAGTAKVYDLPLAPWWEARANSPRNSVLDHFVLPDTVTLKLDAGGVPGRAFTRVYRTPRDFSYEFELGTDPLSDGKSGRPVYGYLRLPAHLPSGKAPNDASLSLWFYFRWRSNGVAGPATGWLEKPDLVCAYYRTGAILDVGLTVTRADPSARTRDRISQSARVTRRVKLRSTVREIREVR